MFCHRPLSPRRWALDRRSKLAELGEVGIDLGDGVLEGGRRQVFVVPRGRAPRAVAGEDLPMFVGHPELREPGQAGGAEGNRTPDLCSAIGQIRGFSANFGLVELRGIEPLTSAVRLQRSPI